MLGLYLRKLSNLLLKAVWVTVASWSIYEAVGTIFDRIQLRFAFADMLCRRGSASYEWPVLFSGR